MAIERNYVRPVLNDGARIEIERGRHPTIEALLGPGEFVPNGALLDAETEQIIILTGPNMAGKSSWLRQVALIVLLAQIGSFVPGRSGEYWAGRSYLHPHRRAGRYRLRAKAPS